MTFAASYGPRKKREYQTSKRPGVPTLGRLFLIPAKNQRHPLRRCVEHPSQTDTDAGPRCVLELSCWGGSVFGFVPDWNLNRHVSAMACGGGVVAPAWKP